jgi:hypothetical protein
VKPKKTREIATNLQRKGFHKIQRNHTFYFLYVNGKKTSVRTKISHGAEEYPASLLKQMAKQLFLSSTEFDDLITCPLTYEKLVEILVVKGVLQNGI